MSIQKMNDDDLEKLAKAEAEEGVVDQQTAATAETVKEIKAEKE